MTAHLARAFPDLTLVEGAEAFCADLRQRFPAVTVVRSLFEDFVPAELYDTIILGHVLEHVENPVDLLRKAGSWLADGGVICCAVPPAIGTTKIWVMRLLLGTSILCTVKATMRPSGETCGSPMRARSSSACASKGCF